MKKNKLIPIILASTNFVICLILLIFLTPDNIPLFVDIHEKIVLISSKWWLLFGLVVPFAFMAITLALKDKYSKLVFTELIIFVFYCNMLAFSYFCTQPSFAIGEVSKISLSLVLFLPISLWMFIYGSIIKNVPYKNKFGIRSKNTQTTEFIWKQTHISASYQIRLCSLLLLLVSIVFIFLRFPLIELAVFAIAMIVLRVIIECGSIKMTNKYNDMKTRQEKFAKKKTTTQPEK